jgi:uncharacterized Zn finger protein
MKRAYVRKPSGKLSARVEINSTCYKIVLYSQGISLRKEGTGTEYHIREGQCSCPAFENYVGDCKHILATRKLLLNLSLSLEQKTILEKSE